MRIRPSLDEDVPGCFNEREWRDAKPGAICTNAEFPLATFEVFYTESGSKKLRWRSGPQDGIPEDWIVGFTPALNWTCPVRWPTCIQLPAGL